ncbi:hypothetical protein CPB85DRAFT_1441558 [Mucidula mucida]|nr:hypothetical protein CPB85DRAFT_1570025 [Mucidula mucida]KAF8888427.1 hypothetical protein CPB85DRAFT_1441558 [Mucidula mucida]
MAMMTTTPIVRQTCIATNKTIALHEDAVTHVLDLWDDGVDPNLLEEIIGIIVHLQEDVVGQTLHPEHEDDLTSRISSPVRPKHKGERHGKLEDQFPSSNGESSRPAKRDSKRMRQYRDRHEPTEPQVQVENYWGDVGDEAEVEIDPTVGPPTFTRRAAYNLDLPPPGLSKPKKYRFGKH